MKTGEVAQSFARSRAGDARQDLTAIQDHGRNSRSS